MISRDVTIVNKLGLHARPAALLVKTSSRFKAEILFKKGNLEVNGKSIMGVMMLAAELGSVITITADGKDEEQAVADIIKVFESKFGEE